MSDPRSHLATELAKKITRHQIVVWDDRERRYIDVARDIIPDGVAFAAYDGSWFALRRQIEPFLSQPERPALVVYAPAPAPDQDPLEEVRAAGHSWTITLKTLLAQSLQGEFTQNRIDELASQARTLCEAEAALSAGGAVDARLLRIFGTADLASIAEDVLLGSRDDMIAGDSAWPLVGAALQAHLGSPPSDDHHADALFRHIALVVLAEALGALPDRLATAAPTATGAQATNCAVVLDRLRDQRRLVEHRALGETFDRTFDLLANLAWDDRLGRVDVSPALEELAFSDGLRRLASGDHQGAQLLAERRLTTSRWAIPQLSRGEALVPGHPYRLWAALDHIAMLHRLVEERRPPATGSPAVLLAWYAESGWEVDQAHRLSELARADLGHLDRLDAHATTARQAYGHWLDEVVGSTTAAIAAKGLDNGHLPRQADIFARHVADVTGPVVYILVDALRLELGHALAERLGRHPGPDGDDPCHAAVAAVPTITPVGMADLLPGAEDGLAVSMEGGNLIVRVGATPVRTVAERVAVIRRAVGTVADFDLSALMSRSDERIREEIKGANVVLVRSTDIDAAGESGRSGTAWRTVDGIIDDLATQILRLGRLGLRRVVISADHGFVVVSEPLSGGRVLERPSGQGETHRRCWIGTGGITPDGAQRFALGDLGVAGGLDLLVPSGLSVFPSAGSRQFFHGGLSPQELLVPVLVLDLDGPPSPAVVPNVTIAVSGKGITTGVFAATMTFKGSLFADEVAVRVVARHGTETAPVARLVAGDGYDSTTGTVTVTVEPAVLTFQITAALRKGVPVELSVLDVSTGLELARVAVPVLASVGVEEEWP